MDLFISVLLGLWMCTVLSSYPTKDINNPYCFDYDFTNDALYRQYLANELLGDNEFKDRWSISLKGLPNVNNYTKNELRALKTYTYNCVYERFNSATKDLLDGIINYGNFSYKALHYYLSRVIEKSKTCSSGLYRGVAFKDTSLRVGDSFKFKQFASSSWSQKTEESFSGIFGTIYTIATCEGADISKYSCYSKQKEVLIQPCARFTVTKVTRGTSSSPLSIVLSSSNTFRSTMTWFIVGVYLIYNQLLLV